VAVVRDVCEISLAAADAGPPHVPAPRDIQITADGAVAFLCDADEAPGDQPVQRVARLLASLVPEAELPVQLRLVLVTAISPTPPYESLFEFHRALEYFERPGRARHSS
jgi:hypothetical protein